MVRYVDERPPCAACRGKQWAMPREIGVDWPTKCRACLGNGRSPTLYALAKHMRLEPRDAYRLDIMKASPRVCALFLDGLAAFLAARPELAA